MKKKTKKILIILLFTILFLSASFIIFIGKNVFDGFSNIVTREETIKNRNTYYEKSYKEFKKLNDVKEIKIESSKFNHHIPAILVRKENNQDLAILIHGLGGTKESMTHQAKVFLDLGFDVLIPDQRNSGDNISKYNTFGVLESFDILDCLNYAKSIYDGKILLFGESAGGAGALIAASRDDSLISYLILDCPVSDANKMMEKELKKIEEKEGVPVSFMRFSGDIYTRIKLGYSFSDFDTTKWIKESNFRKPTLFINSQIDKVTPYQMAVDIFDSLPGDKKELKTIKDYGHAELAREDSKVFKK